MKREMFRKAAVLLVVLMLCMFSACTKSADTDLPTSEVTGSSTSETTDATTTEPESSSAPEWDTITQLDVFSMSANNSGDYSNTWWGEILKEDIGVSINLLPFGDSAKTKLQALMASGELPDICIINNNSDILTAIKGEMLVNLDEHLDALPNVVQNAPFALQYSRDELSNETGKAYCIGYNIGPENIAKEPTWGPYIRWDLYKQAGSPSIASLDDYLDVLKEMQDLYPETPDGKKVYAISIFKDWDGNSMFCATQWGQILGIDCGSEVNLPFIQIDLNTNDITCSLDENGKYLECLKFYFDANQMGILDPDSLTQTFETLNGKATDGRVLFGWWSFLFAGYNTTDHMNADTPTGYMAVVPSNAKTYLYMETNPIGSQWRYCIGSATRNLDAALRYVDYMYSVDGLKKLLNGPEGYTWSINGDGKPELTEEGWEFVNDPTKELTGGGKLADGVDIINCQGLRDAFIDPETGESLNHEVWSATKAKLAEDKSVLEKDWSSVYSADNAGDYLKKNNMYTPIPIIKNLVPAIPDDINSTATMIGDLVKTYSWKMVFAKDEAEFQSLYEEMLTKANGLGLETVYEWSKSAWEQSVEKSSKYE